MFTIKQKSGKIKSKRNYLRTEYKVPCFIVYNKIKIKYILAYIYIYDEKGENKSILFSKTVKKSLYALNSFDGV